MRKGPNGAPGRAANPYSVAWDHLVERMKRADRTRSLSQFMAWCFVVAETFERASALAGVAHSSSDSDASDFGYAKAGPAGLLLDTSDEAANAGSDDDDKGDASGASSSLGIPYLGSIGGGDGAGFAAKILGSGTNHASLHHTGHTFVLHGSAHAGISFVAGGGGIPNVPIIVPPNVVFDAIPFDPASLDYFNGLKDFTKGMGFEAGASDFAAAAPGTSGGAVEAALAFTDNALTPFGFWQSLGQFSSTAAPTTADRFDSDWLVQLNGVKDGAYVEAERAKGFSSAEHEIARDATASQFGNSASATDAHDWSGTLWVRENYYEFNTVIQVNVLWDKDKISVSNFLSGPKDEDAVTIRSGDNVQKNAASIGVSDGVSDDPLHQDVAPVSASQSLDTSHQLVLGGRTEHSAAFQFNSIVDTDEISFNLDHLLGDTIGSLDFASVFSAGHTQENRSTIVSTNDGFSGGMSAIDFYELKKAGPIKLVNGDFYEFNTIVQMNVIFDRDDIVSRFDDDDGDGGRGGVIASGGTLQFNRASLAKADHNDDLFVGGRYSQYNLVLQINALDDSDEISQVRGGRTRSHDTDDTPLGSDGGSGHDGDHASNSSLPSIHDDHMARGLDAMMS